jgi:hypothetical protein
MWRWSPYDRRSMWQTSASKSLPRVSQLRLHETVPLPSARCLSTLPLLAAAAGILEPLPDPWRERPDTCGNKQPSRSELSGGWTKGETWAITVLKRDRILAPKVRVQPGEVESGTAQLDAVGPRCGADNDWLHYAVTSRSVLVIQIPTPTSRIARLCVKRSECA